MATVQNHIHLDTVISSAPENAPVLTWRVTKRTPQPVVFLNVDYTKQGYLRPTLLKSGATPVRLTNFKYTLKVKGTDADDTDDLRDALTDMLGQTVYLVDNRHCDDGEDHDTYVRTMLLTEVGEFKVDHVMLDFYYVDVTLLDASRT